MSFLPRRLLYRPRSSLLKTRLVLAGQDAQWPDSQSGPKERTVGFQSPPPPGKLDLDCPMLSHPCFPIPSPLTNSRDSLQRSERSDHGAGHKGSRVPGSQAIHSSERVPARPAAPFLAGTMPRPSLLPGHKARWP
jgi:hypothetical protein